MRQIGALPTSLEVNGREYGIYSDFRSCLAVLQAMGDEELDDWQKVQVCLALYEAFETDAMPPEDYEAAYMAACDFLDHGGDDDRRPPQRLMDWGQDEDILFPAVNRAAGFEVRAVEYLHWWTFLGCLMSVDHESVWATVLSLRSKRAKGKSLEKWEAEYWAANKGICQLRHKDTPEEKARREELKKLFV